MGNLPPRRNGLWQILTTWHPWRFHPYIRNRTEGSDVNRLKPALHIQARLPLSYPGNLTSRFRPNHTNGKKSINISLKNRQIKPLDLAGSKKNPNFALRKGATAHAQGVVLEWLKRHAWKACIRQKRIPSSNLGHSAMNTLEAINPHIPGRQRVLFMQPH